MLQYRRVGLLARRQREVSAWFGGLKVSLLRREQVLASISGAIGGASQLTITFINPDYARRAMTQPSLRRDINGFDLVLVDGNGVRLLAPLFGFSVPERLDTDSLAPDLFRALAESGTRTFLFGCAPGVAERAASRLTSAYPGMVVAGFEHGYLDVARGHPGWFDTADTDDVIDAVNDAGTQVLLVSLPTPLQQQWVSENRGRLNAAVIMTAGSYLDHVAQWEDTAASWYPSWANMLRLNWLYRLLREPRRLWRRYTVELVMFTGLVVRERFGTCPSRGHEHIHPP